jgi:hypothetical protein
MEGGVLGGTKGGEVCFLGFALLFGVGGLAPFFRTSSSSLASATFSFFWFGAYAKKKKKVESWSHEERFAT